MARTLVEFLSTIVERVINWIGSLLQALRLCSGRIRFCFYYFGLSLAQLTSQRHQDDQPNDGDHHQICNHIDSEVLSGNNQCGGYIDTDQLSMIFCGHGQRFCKSSILDLHQLHFLGQVVRCSAR